MIEADPQPGPVLKIPYDEDVVKSSKAEEEEEPAEKPFKMGSQKTVTEKSTQEAAKSHSQMTMTRTPVIDIPLAVKDELTPLITGIPKKKKKGG